MIFDKHIPHSMSKSVIILWSYLEQQDRIQPNPFFLHCTKPAGKAKKIEKKEKILDSLKNVNARKMKNENFLLHTI